MERVHKQLSTTRREFLRSSGAGLLAGTTGFGLAFNMIDNAYAQTSVFELTALEAVTRIRRGELKAEAYADLLLGRYRSYKSLNTVTWMDESRVLEEARRIDAKRARGEQLGTLAGLPVIVKDNIAVAGTPTAAATLTLRDNIAIINAPVVQSLFDQDAVFFARANMHELAGGGTSSNASFGAVGNPYDPKRIPGGSSGGTAAAIAARIVPAGLGSDTAGSVRLPAALSGTAGLRPTIVPRKLYSEEGVVPLALDLDTVGPMARTVTDVALLHAAITGTRMSAATQLKALRIGIPRKPYWVDLEPDVERVCENALERLRDAGVVLIEVDAGSYYRIAHEVYMTLVTNGIKQDLKPYLAAVGARVSADQVIANIASRDTRALFEERLTAEIYPATLKKARTTTRAKILEAYREMFRSQGIVAIAYPTAPVAAPLINIRGDTRDAQIELNGRPVSEALTLLRNTRVTGALGVPGLSLPAGLTQQGLPVGLELDGISDGDSELLALGVAIETVLGRLPAPMI